MDGLREQKETEMDSRGTRRLDGDGKTRKLNNQNPNPNRYDHVQGRCGGLVVGCRGGVGDGSR